MQDAKDCGLVKAVFTLHRIGLWFTHKNGDFGAISVACVASVSVRFRSKERGTRVKDLATNGASKRAGRGWGRKEGNACRQTPGF